MTPTPPLTDAQVIEPEGERFSALPPLDRLRLRLQRIGALKEFWNVRDGEIEAEIDALDAALQRLQGWQQERDELRRVIARLEEMGVAMSSKDDRQARYDIADEMEALSLEARWPAPPAPGSARPTEAK